MSYICTLGAIVTNRLDSLSSKVLFSYLLERSTTNTVCLFVCHISMLFPTNQLSRIRGSVLECQILIPKACWLIGLTFLFVCFYVMFCHINITVPRLPHWGLRSNFCSWFTCFTCFSCFLFVFNLWHIYFTVPTATPQSFGVSVRDSQTLLIYWLEVPLEHRHGIIQGYGLTYWNARNGTSQVITLKASENSFVLTPLLKATVYVVHLWAFTSAGNGVVGSYTAMTEEDSKLLSFFLSFFLSIFVGRNKTFVQESNVKLV